MEEPRTGFDAVVFDLLTALLDSWTLWNDVAGGEEPGMRWRRRYLEITYAAGAYRPYEELVEEAARDAGLPRGAAGRLRERWGELEPWPEAPAVLRELAARVPLAVVTNCSAHLGGWAAGRTGVAFPAVITAERVGRYKPDPAPYRAALEALRVQPERALFVAGSPGDVSGAGAVGMTVFWHDRLGLREEVGRGPARWVEDSLRPLPEVVGPGPGP